MPGLFVQSLSRNFFRLGYGAIKSILKLENTYNKLRSRVKNICEVNSKNIVREINRIIVQLKALIRILNNVLIIVRKILRFTRFLKRLIVALIILTKILKFLPLPSRWVTVGIHVKLGDVLSKINFQLKTALVIVTGIDLVVRYIAGFIGNIINRIRALISSLRNISEQLLNCVAYFDSLAGIQPLDQRIIDGLNIGLDSNEEDLLNGLLELEGADRLRREADLRRALGNNLNSELDNLDNLLNDLNGQLGNLLSSNNSYKGFTFSIVEEQTVEKVIAKRRSALAFNSKGILALQGQPSFATDTQVLIDELKLRIDNENLTGYSPDENNNQDNINAQNDINNINNNLNNVNNLGQGNQNNNESLLNTSTNDLTINNVSSTSRTGEEDEEFNLTDLESEIADEFGLDNPDDVLADSLQSERDIEELTNTDSNEKALKEKYNRRQRRFIRMLEKQAAKNNDKAKELLSKLNKKEINIPEARSEWLSYRSERFLRILT